MDRTVDRHRRTTHQSAIAVARTEWSVATAIDRAAGAVGVNKEGSKR